MTSRPALVRACSLFAAPASAGDLLLADSFESGSTCLWGAPAAALADVVSAGDVLAAQSTLGRPDEHEGSCYVNGSTSERVYRFESTATATYHVSTISADDVVIFRREICGDPSTELDCADVAQGAEELTFALDDGAVIFVFVEGYSSATVDFTLNATVVSVCGNSVVEGSEECDNADLAGENCLTLGYSAGSLGCTPECAFDTSSCSTCGNGIIEASEVCDGLNLNGESCISQGFSGGSLGCSAACDAFDVTGCV